VCVVFKGALESDFDYHLMRASMVFIALWLSEVVPI